VTATPASVSEARQLARGEVAIPGRDHLLARRQIEPELEAFHPPLRLLRDLGMDQTAARGHPLDAAGLDQTFVARAVAMQHAPGDHIGHGLEAAVRVIRKAGDIVVRIVAAEGIEHQEGIEPLLQRLGQHPDQVDAGTVGGRLADDQSLDGAGLPHGLGLKNGFCHLDRS
jgi:hypothetical protein